MANILVVEDEPITARDIAECLEQQGHTISNIVATGHEALLSAARARPDLAIMDIRIQGAMDGVSTALRLQSEYETPVLYLSAYADARTVERVKETIPYGFVMKPFDARTLQAAVGVALSRRRADSAVCRRAEWLSTLVEAIGDGVLATDATGLLRFANRVALDLLACGPGWEGLPAASLARFVDERTREFLGDPIAEVLKRRTPAELPSGCVLRGYGGSETPVEGSLAPLVDAEGFHGVVLVLRDMTARRQAERERQRVQRLQSLEVLAGGLAHDFNNMLTMIMAGISFSRTLLEPDSRVSELLQQAESQCERATSVTRQLLTFAKGGAPVCRATTIGSLVEDTVGFAVRGRGVSQECDIDESLWVTEVDEGQIAQVISNLVINACEAMPQGGAVRVVARNRILTEEDGLPLLPGPYVEVAVRDEGLGILPEQIEQIFDPYFSTKDRGSGLGLTAAFSIVRAHRGHICVESQLEQGTTFHVYLPAAAKARDPSPTDGLDAPKTAAGLRVLLMDDEAQLLDIVSACLREMGHRVECVRDGQEAIRRYRQAMSDRDPFDVVILDLTVPGGMGGAEAIRRLQVLDPSVRAIASSGYSKSTALADPRSHGFVAILPKPYRFGMLARALEEAVGSSSQNEVA